LAADLTGFIVLRLPAPVSAPVADFVPPIVAFFAVSAPRIARNFFSRAGLIRQPDAAIVIAAPNSKQKV
jgi:hypothetical protein